MFQREKTCPELPLDPFSVFADQVLSTFPWLEDIVDIDPQTAEAHQVRDRCWTSTLWEVSPYHVECTMPDNPAHVTHGMDYLSGYWLGVYYGVLPGDGPYGGEDDDATDDDDDDAADDDTQNDDDSDDENAASEDDEKSNGGSCCGK